MRGKSLKEEDLVEQPLLSGHAAATANEADGETEEEYEDEEDLSKKKRRHSQRKGKRSQKKAKSSENNAASRRKSSSSGSRRQSRSSSSSVARQVQQQGPIVYTGSDGVMEVVVAGKKFKMSPFYLAFESEISVDDMMR